MLSIDIEVPPPSRFVPDDQIDEIALAYNQAYRVSSNKASFPVDIDRFIDRLEIPVSWEEIEEPDEALLLARYAPENGGSITINKRHQDLFVKRQDVYASCLGHEVGHRVLCHCDHAEFNVDTPSLFDDPLVKPRLFHRSSWHQYGMTKEEVLERKALEQELVKLAAKNERARQAIAQMQNRFEPEWMFWQAEHFSLCFLVPKDRLVVQLEEGWNFNSWYPIYRLAERFGVSSGMMRRRLVKLKVIEIGDDGQPRLRTHQKQERLF